MKNKKIQNVISLVVFIILFFLIYFGLFKFHYIYPLGGDSAYHISLIDNILQFGDPKPEYAQGMHMFLSALALIINVDVVTIVTYFAPFLLILCFASAFILVRYIFGYKTAIIAIIIFALVSRHPYWIWSDGTYASMFASEFLAFIFFFLLLKLFKNGKMNYVISSALFFIAICISHLLSFLYILLILIVFSILFFAYHLLKKKKIKNLRNILIFYAIIIVFAIIPAWFWYLGNYFVPIIFSMLQISTGTSATAESIRGINIVKVPAFMETISLIGYKISIFALLSIVFLKNIVVKKPTAILLLLSALFIFAIGSMTRLSPDPIRVTRELALIINIFAAFFIVNVIFYYKNNKLLQSFSIIIIFIIIFYNTPQNLLKYLTYQSQISIEDQQAVNWIKKNTPKESIIMLSPSMGEKDRKSPFDFVLKGYNLIPTFPEDSVIKLPKSSTAKEYINKNKINYIYYRNMPVGWYPINANWKFGEYLEESDYLETIEAIKGNDITIKIIKIK